MRVFLRCKIVKYTFIFMLFYRQDCFGTKFFYGCMEMLLVKEELKNEVANYLDDVHANNFGSNDKMKK